jgi:hypothetical protein
VVLVVALLVRLVEAGLLTKDLLALITLLEATMLDTLAAAVVELVLLAELGLTKQVVMVVLVSQAALLVPL